MIGSTSTEDVKGYGWKLELKPTKQDYINSIIGYTHYLVHLKWYEFSEKKYAKRKIRQGLKEYYQLLRAE